MGVTRGCLQSLPRLAFNPERRKVGQNWQKPDSHLGELPESGRALPPLSANCGHSRVEIEFPLADIQTSRYYTEESKTKGPDECTELYPT